MNKTFEKNSATKVALRSKTEEYCSQDVMQDNELSFVIGCPICSRRIAEAYPRSKAFVRCEKCSSELFYEVYEDGPRIKVCKGPKKRLA